MGKVPVGKVPVGAVTLLSPSRLREAVNPMRSDIRPGGVFPDYAAPIVRNAATGRELAEQRTAFMRVYLNEFRRELAVGPHAPPLKDAP